MLHPDAFPEPLRSFEGYKEFFFFGRTTKAATETQGRAVCLFVRLGNGLFAEPRSTQRDWEMAPQSIFAVDSTKPSLFSALS